VPLQQSLRVRERAVLLDVSRRREEEDLRRDLLGLQLPRLDLGAVVPERRRLDLDEVADDEPVELGQAAPLRAPVRRADGGVLADHEVALDLAAQHLLHGPVVRVVVVDPRQVGEAELVLLARGLTPPCLEERDDVRVELAPPARLRLVELEPLVETRRVFGVRHVDVAGQCVVERRDVC
jgi:hypothetical protein